MVNEVKLITYNDEKKFNCEISKFVLFIENYQTHLTVIVNHPIQSLIQNSCTFGASSIFSKRQKSLKKLTFQIRYRRPH